MTNAEKYEEVFGFPPAALICPTSVCANCPLYQTNTDTDYIDPDCCCPNIENWWNSEYRGGKE